MKRISTKSTAEAVLRELPSVMGAYVSEDLEGHLREIHLLIGDGPDPGSLARDIRGLLEERLGIPIDQRVISIAQLAETSRPEALSPDPVAPQGSAVAPAAAEGGRPVYAGIESTTTAGHVVIAVRLKWGSRESTGTADAVDTQPGRARAAAAATLRSAAEAPWNDGLGLELDFASIVQALDGEYVLVSVLALAPRLGRRPLPLVGVHPVDSDVESAASLATLKAINRVLSLALKQDYSSSSSD
jgi:hypothetical protein